MTKKTKKRIVNVLTLSRVIGAFILPLILTKLSIPKLILLLAFLFITDFLDGVLARSWRVQTIGGSLLDPLGDKALAISCLFVLISTHIDYLALLVFEIAIMSLNIYRTLHGENVKSNYVGKFKTWILSITLIIGAIHLFNPNIINELLKVVGLNTSIFHITDNVILVTLIVAGIAEVFTLISYIKETIQNREKSPKVYKLKPLKEMMNRLFDEEMFSHDRSVPLIEVIKE